LENVLESLVDLPAAQIACAPHRSVHGSPETACLRLRSELLEYLYARAISCPFQTQSCTGGAGVSHKPDVPLESFGSCAVVRARERASARESAACALRPPLS
jgi:hypothetical protein